MRIAYPGTKILPGAVLALAVTALAMLLEHVERLIWGYGWLDALVLAIILGALYRTFCGAQPRFEPGIRFCAKTVLEIAIVLLGATISAASLTGHGPWLLGLVALAVFLSLGAGYTIGRILGLPGKLAVLVACGNSICGNSAIVAAAPVLDARPDDVASAIAFTAALGIVVVLLLPLAASGLMLDQAQYGILAGMTVYAVPQVLAATVPVGTLSTQIGAVVKLMRVVMLGPVVVILGLGTGRNAHAPRPAFSQLVPWFIPGFLIMMALRSAGAIGPALLPGLEALSGALTIVSMAALGLSVDIRGVLASGGRVLAAGTLSLAALAGLSMAMLAILPGL